MELGAIQTCTSKIGTEQQNQKQNNPRFQKSSSFYSNKDFQPKEARHADESGRKTKQNKIKTSPNAKNLELALFKKKKKVSTFQWSNPKHA